MWEFNLSNEDVNIAGAVVFFSEMLVFSRRH